MEKNNFFSLYDDEPEGQSKKLEEIKDHLETNIRTSRSLGTTLEFLLGKFSTFLKAILKSKI